MKLKNNAPDGAPIHYYGTSVYEWKVSESLESLIRQFKASGHNFQIMIIRLPIGAKYEISHYLPVVDEGVMSFVGSWTN